MTDVTTQRFVRGAVSLCALSCAVIGLLFLFGPDQAGRTLLLDAGGPLIQLLGAASLGFSAMNWTARGSMLGGIYGKSVVAGNQTHFTIGALLLLKHGLAEGGSPAFWTLAIFYVLGAALFNYLSFFSSGIGAGTKGK